MRQLGLVMVGLSLSVLAVSACSALVWLGLGPGDADRPVDRVPSGTVTALRLHEGPAVVALLATAGGGALVGLGLWQVGRGGRSTFLGRREALLIVAGSWLVGAAIAAIPYKLWAVLGAADAPTHPFHRLVDCYFEAISGLTTTGATVLGDHGHTIDQLPRGILLWRALTQWLGGLGIVVLFVAVLPSLGVGARKLFQVEAPGPEAPGVRPRIGETARALWMIYLGLTVVEVIALWCCGSTLFDAVCHTMSTMATGGFSAQNASIGVAPAAVQIVIVVFMVLAGVNFGLYYQLIHLRFKRVLTDPELRLYAGILLVASIVVVLAIATKPIATTSSPEPMPASWGQALRHGVFQVVSILTGTGFCTADFDRWGLVPKAVLLGLMFAGACSGSTGGGIKVIRILIVVKLMVAEIERVFRPHVVRTVRVGRLTVDSDQKVATLVYIVTIAALFVAGTALILIFEQRNGCSFTTAATASAATLNNVGPGLAGVGATRNYGGFGAASKITMSILMVLGRLELYAILVLLAPRFWRTE